MTVTDSQWKQLSQRLDELLDLPPEARNARLNEIREREPEAAAALEGLLSDVLRAPSSSFLEGRADAGLLRDAGTASLAGTPVGAYVLESQLGSGSTGTVWRARRGDGRFTGTVAVKLLHLSLVGQVAAKRFQQEGEILARLAHPHIAHMLDAGVTAQQQPYLVLELVEGLPIDRHCDANGVDVARRIALFQDVLSAVAHAHSHLVVHRDIKPSNVLVGTGGNVKLLDFGIATLLERERPVGGAWTRDGARVLTPEYAAPEQVSGADVTTATDVYSLGVLLHVLLAGQHPHESSATNPAELMQATLAVDPPPLSGALSRLPPVVRERLAARRGTTAGRWARQLSGDLENIVAKALRKKPADRYATVDAFADDLRRWQDGEPVRARPQSLVYRATRFVGRHRLPVAVATLALCAVLAGLAGTISQARRAEAQRAEAIRQAAVAQQERDAAVQQQVLQRGTSEFFALVLRDGTNGDPGAVRKQLDRSVVLVRQGRFEQPIVKVALLRMLATRYAELGDQRTAVGLNREAIASIAGTDLAKPTSGVPVNLACSLAARLIDLGDTPGALAELDRADRLLAAGAEVSAPSRVSCLEQRGYAASALGQHEVSVRAFREALDRLAAAGVREGEQLRVVRSGLSMALGDAGDIPAAMAIAREVAAESESTQGTRSVATLNRRAIVTRLTRLGGDPLKALAMSDADRKVSADIRGPGHDDAALELERGRILLDLAQYAEAVDAFSRSAAAAERDGDEPQARLAGLGAVEGLVGAGRLDAATRRLDALPPPAEGSPVPQRIDWLRLQALIASRNGRPEAATAALREAEHLAEPANGVANPKQLAIGTARVDLDLSLNRAGPEDDTAADRVMAVALRSALDRQRSSAMGKGLLLKARLEALGKRQEDALRDAADAAAQLAPTLGEDHPDTRLALALARH